MAREPITPKTLRSLQHQMDRLRQIITRSADAADFTSAIRSIQAGATVMPSLEVFVHDMAEQMMPEATQGNTVQPQLFAQILGLLDTEEKCDSILANMSEPEGRLLNEHLGQLLHGVLPDMRKVGLETLKQLPHRRGGGREKVIDEERAEKICQRVAKLHQYGVSKSSPTTCGPTRRRERKNH